MKKVTLIILCSLVVIVVPYAGWMLLSSPTVVQPIIYGTVRDSQTNNPIVGATVQCLKSDRQLGSCVTDSRGVFYVPAVYEQAISSPGYRMWKITILVTKSKCRAESLELTINPNAPEAYPIDTWQCYVEVTMQDCQ